jgi:hypothetical protein
MLNVILARLWRAFACQSWLVVLGAGTLACFPSGFVRAQSPAVHGYITAVHPPDSFDVNGEHVLVTAGTRFGLIGAKGLPGNEPTRDAMAVGAWVEVVGDQYLQTVTAQTVLFRDVTKQELQGLGVVVRVISTVPELVIAADGYRIRVTPETETHFPKEIKSIADVRAGMWVAYEGRLDRDGILGASRAKFVTTSHRMEQTGHAAKDPNQPPKTAKPLASSAAAVKNNAPPSNDGTGGTDVPVDDQRTEISLDEYPGYSYKLSKDRSLQAIVRRVGMSLVPTYQKQLPTGDPSKIHFYFCAVTNSWHEELSSSEGTVLIPARLAERFKSDDQLAALLADGIAYTLQQHAPLVFVKPNRAAIKEAAGLAAASAIPYAGLGVGAYFNHRIDQVLTEQRGRVALQLMADTGYDPWQAPEAWRLAAPSKLPADTSKLKYPDRSGYLLGILNLMYRKPAAGNAAERSSTAAGGASGKP